MADLQGRKIFKVFNQDFIVDERYTVTKELGQGAYGIVWYVHDASTTSPASLLSPAPPHRGPVIGIRKPRLRGQQHG
jgi:mitogen-activated protein kinase 7